MNIQKLIFSVLGILFFVMTAQAGTNDTLVYSGKPGDYFHPQGICKFETGAIPTLCNAEYKPTTTNLCQSTWSCHGDGKDILKATYANGLKICVFIDNAGYQNYFVPMNTAEEWNSFSDKSATPPELRIVVGCPGGVKQDPCGNKYNLPDARVSDNPTDRFHFETTGDYSVDFFCPATLKVKDKATGIESSVPVVNCGEWQVTETGNCVDAVGLSFNGKVCADKSIKPAEFVMVLDASASMDQLLGSAQNALRALVGKYLVPRPDIPVTIAVIGGDFYASKLNDPSKEDCTYGRLFGPLAADATQINRLVSPVVAMNNTPIDTSLRYAANFFQDSSKRRVMLVLTDGYETCFGNPAFAVKQLRDQGIEVYGIKYGSGQDSDALSVFNAMNKFSPANSQSEITSAIEDIVKDVTIKSCKPILRLYAPGDTNGDPVYTILADQTVRIKRGTYDAVVDYCSGKQLYPNQTFDADRSFDFNQNCPR